MWKWIAVLPVTLLVGCATAPMPPAGNTVAGTPPAAATGAQGTAVAQANAPEPIYGNTGKYMCPFTEDGTVAPWVEKGMAASVGANVGAAAGAYAGQKALEQVPFFGGMLGRAAGQATGREIAIKASGGWDFIKSSSDLSFNSLEDMAHYLHATNSAHPQYAKVLQATYGIYPDLKQRMLVVSRRR